MKKEIRTLPLAEPIVDNPIQISAVELDGNDGVFVMYSDGTTSGYVIEELLALRPYREPFRTLHMQDSSRFQ